MLHIPRLRVDLRHHDRASSEDHNVDVVLWEDIGLGGVHSSGPKIVRYSDRAKW